MLHLLLVDDDLVDRAAVKRAIQAAGLDASVHEVDDLDAAIARLREHQVDCVLLDYRLPKGDGLDLLRRARALGIRTPFIALTGQGDEQLAAEMMRAGAADYVSKSALTPERLALSLRHALAMAQAEEDRRALLAREQAAREEAQSANHAKDEFLAMLSHELRTPLNAILGWARLLAGGTLDASTATRASQTIERNAWALARLIEDLLDISRVTTGKVRLDLEPADLRATVDSVLESLRPQAAAKSLRLQSAVPDQACQIMGDPARLHQIVSNLLSNAIKFTPDEGSVTVTVTATGTHATLTVRDSGIGLDPAFLPHVFERFRQADSGFTRQQGGLGLGLTIVKHLVRLHGGDVTAASDGVGQGATFTVTLPLLPAHVPTRPGAMRPGRPELAGIHVLAVDDNAEALSLLEVVLTGFGARVTTASSAAEALAALDAEVPDVLVSDIGMPGSDGISLIRAIRTSPRPDLQRLAAAAITAYASAADRQHAIDAGYQAHLAKPVNPDELGALVASLAIHA